MKYEVVFTRAAVRALGQIPERDRARIGKRIEALAQNPRPGGARRLQGGEGEHRIRIGAYRVIYLIDDGRLIVTVVRVGDRKDIYR